VWGTHIDYVTMPHCRHTQGSSTKILTTTTYSPHSLPSMQSNFRITYSQPTFELPRKPIVSLVDRASLTMVPRATAGLNSSPTVKSQLTNPPPSPTHIDSPDNAMSTPSNDSSGDFMNQLMDQLVHEVNLMSSYEVMTNSTLSPVGRALAQSALIQLTRWSHPMNLLYTLPYAHGRRILPGSIQSGIRLISG